MKYIIPSTPALHLGNKIAKQIKRRGIQDTQIIFPKKNKDGERYFPDDEVYSAIPESEKGIFDGQEVVFLHSGQRKPNTGIVELETNIEIVSEHTIPKKMGVFFAYIPYSKSDKHFRQGEIAKSEKLFNKLRRWYGIQDICIIDAHFAGRDHWDYENRPFTDVKGYEVIMKGIEEKFGKEVLYLGPDIGSRIRAGLEGTDKARKDSYTVNVSAEDELIDLIKRHSHIAAIDDFTETGGTMVEFSNFCREHNPKAVLIAGLTHGVKQGGINRTVRAYDHLYLGNSIQRRKAHPKQWNIDFTELIMKSLGIIE